MPFESRFLKSKCPLATDGFFCYTNTTVSDMEVHFMDAEQKVSALRGQFRRLRQLYFLLLVLAVLALILYFVNPWYALAALGASLAFHLLLIRRKSKAYVADFTALAAELTLQRHLENARFSPRPVLTETQVRQARMVPCNAASGGVVCHQGGTGRYHGREVALGDVTIAHSFTENGKKRHNFTIGCWVSVTLEEDTGLDCRFLGSSITPADSLKEMLWVEEDLRQCPPPILLREPWRMVQGGGDVIPPDAFLKQLDRLSRKTEGRVAVCIQGKTLHVLLVGEILAQKVSGRIAPGDRFAEADLLPSLEDALALSDKLA